MWYSHTGEYYTAIKRNEVHTHTHTHTNLEHIMLSEKKPATKGYILYVFIYVKYPEYLNAKGQKAVWWLPGAGEGKS